MKLKILLLSFLAVFLMAGSAFALGMNITIYDNRGYSGLAAGGEDNETEPDMINAQDWDLEGFFLEGTTLTMVGGWDFLNGKSYGDKQYNSGDIFIDIDGDAKYGDGADSSYLNYGYDYVLQVNWSDSNYNVFGLSSNSILVPVQESYNDPKSNPWRYGGGDDVLDGWNNVDFSAFGTLTDDETDFAGGTHNYVAFDLTFLGSDINNFIAHFTMGCGNDNLMGSSSVPEPSTMLLFGTGFLGLAMIGRKKLFKK